MNTASKPKPRIDRRLALFIGGGIVILCLICGIVYAVSPKTAPQPAQDVGAIYTAAAQTMIAQMAAQPPAATAAAPRIASPPPPALALNLSLRQFVDKYDSLTDLQKKDYIASVQGQTVDWTGTVRNIDSSGTIVVDIPETLLSSVYLEGVPVEISRQINKGSSITYTGTIDRIVDILGLTIHLIDVHVSQ